MFAKKSRFTAAAGALAILGLFLAVAVPQSGVAANTTATPVGIWKTVDDTTQKARSHVQIWQYKDKLYGKIVRLIDEKEDTPLCDKCPGNLKNKPVIGLAILNGVARDGDQWTGGTILDPESGKTYKVLLELQDNGARLKVRGYIGVSLLGRTQYWHRVK